MKESKNLDRLFQEKFRDFEQVPPAAVWSNIEAELEAKKKDKRFLWLWIGSIAAGLALLFNITGVFNTNQTIPVTTGTQKTETKQPVFESKTETEIIQNNSKYNTPISTTTLSNTTSTFISQQENNTFSYGLIISTKNSGLKAKDNEVFKGMKTHKESLDLVAEIMINTQIILISIEATKDINASNDYQATMKVRGVSPISSEKGLQTRPYAGIRYQNAKTVDYHYGVRNSEETENRKAYKGKSATTPFIGLEIVTNLTSHLTLDPNLDYESRANSIRNSPLTNGKKYDLKGAISITYWF